MGEIRIHTIFIAVLVFSLFAVVLFAETKAFMGTLGLSNDDILDGMTDGNASNLFTELDVITESKDEVTNMANQAPGGIDSTLPEDSSTTEGSMQKSGLGMVTSAGKFLYSVPKLIIWQLADFLHVRREFAVVGSASIILIVAIILVSSIMRNRL